MFVLAYGRSGSTLLMGILNSIPGYCIRGENTNALHALFEFYSRVLESQKTNRKNAERPTHPWYGQHLVDMESLKESLRDLFIAQVLHPISRDRVVGFKEIRTSEKEVPDLEGYVSFIRDVFAPCKLIINHRNLDNVSGSAWWRDMPLARDKLAVIDERLNQIPAGEDVYHFSYDQLIADPAYIKALLNFLGEAYDDEAIRAVLNTRHSY